MFSGLVLHLSQGSRPQPLREDSMLTGPALKPTNEPYAIRENRRQSKMVEAYRSQYGLGLHQCDADQSVRGPATIITPNTSHVVAALIRRFHEAKAIRASPMSWSGAPGHPRVREFLYVDGPWPDACVHLMKNYSGEELVNIGTGEEHHDRPNLRGWSPRPVGYTRRRSASTPSRPDGTPRKLLDWSAALPKLGWRARAPRSRMGFELAYRAYLSESKQAA